MPVPICIQYHSRFSSLCILLLCLIGHGSSYAQSRRMNDSLELRLRNAASDTARVLALADLSKSNWFSDTAKAREYAQRALDLSKKINYRRGVVLAENTLGTVFMNRADYETSHAWYEASLKDNETLNDEEERGDSYNQLGTLARIAGNYTLSIDYLIKAQKIFDKTRNYSGIARSLMGMGNIYYTQKQFNLAGDAFRKALAERVKMGDSTGVADCCNNLGAVYKNLKGFDEAFAWYRRAMSIYEKQENKSGIGFIYSNMGTLYLEKKEPQKALDYLLKSQRIDEELGSRDEMAISYGNLAEAYMELKDYDKALESITKSLEIYKELKDAEGVELSYGGLASIYEYKKDFEKAYHYFGLYTQLRDSLFTKESSKQIAEMDAKYQSGKKEHAIEMLNKDKELDQVKLKKQGVVIYAIGGGMLLLGVLVFIVIRSNKQKQKANLLLAEQKEVIAHQKEIVEEKNKEVTDSIRYAKRIQDAILPKPDQVKAIAGDCFIFYRPKDIVSGDFYWFEKWGNHILFAVADCTGHGVPGAFMSIVGSNLLNQLVNEQGLTKPSLILNALNKGLSRTLRQNQEETGVKDGMDIALCSLNTKTLELEYAGAFNPLWLVIDGELKEIRADKFPVGAFLDEKPAAFTSQKVQLKTGDLIYLFSDGFADQFGGPKGKKFKYKQLQELILSMHRHPLEDQKEKLQKTLEEWKDKQEQTDDICIVGFRVSPVA